LSLSGELVALARRRDMAANPFVKSVRDGSCTRASLAIYATSCYQLAERFPRQLFSLLSICHDDAAQVHLLGNVMEEIGATNFEPGKGVVTKRERHHLTMARRFADSLDVSEESLAVPVGRTSQWLIRQIDTRNFIGALAFLAVGNEANVSTTFAMLIDPLREHYGLSEEDLRFLSEHVEVDERHGSDGADIVAALVSNDQQRCAATEGVRRGALSWWHFHRLIEGVTRNSEQ
jgi:pyrroloquinoline quinone (PQQ) biosynthesis protein C